MMDECKGCLGCSYKKDPYENIVKHILLIKLKQCPCNICLIKMMCVDACGERTKYYEGLVKLERKENGRLL